MFSDTEKSKFKSIKREIRGSNYIAEVKAIRRCLRFEREAGTLNWNQHQKLLSLANDKIERLSERYERRLAI